MQWLVTNKKADFKGIGSRYHIDQVTARILRNRDLTEDEQIRLFLQGKLEDLPDAHRLKDGERLVEILAEKIREQAHIRIIGDYDIDGVMSTYILLAALKRCQAKVSARIPDRIKDGYGLNANLIREACEDGVDTILTCDNGIAAIGEIKLAKESGMTVLVTDHHEIPYREEKGERIYLESEADAIVNPHQPACPYPHKNLCGAGVAWKIILLLYEKMQIPRQEAEVFLENVAFATVGDIMDLTGENRILVKEGLKRIKKTQNIGMKALIRQCGVAQERIESYHFGFVLGPCINASGRLDTAKRALELLCTEEEEKALAIANELVILNEERKQMTLEGTEEAIRICEEEGYESDPVLVIYLPEVHESIAGIIAGRIRERYYKPTFILTNGLEGVKGSGRSVEEYSMYEELCRCQSLLTKFGGHPMAAGLSLPRENVDRFRMEINGKCPQNCRNLEEKLKIDVPMPMSYVTMDLVREFDLLAPFGKGNPKPVFADRELSVQRIWTVGKTRTILRLSLRTREGVPVSAVYFGDAEKFMEYISRKFGEEELRNACRGLENSIILSAVYYPKIDTYRDQENLVFEIQVYR